jgi:hypothetical protein
MTLQRYYASQAESPALARASINDRYGGAMRYDRSWAVAGIESIRTSGRCITQGSHRGGERLLRIVVQPLSAGASLTLNDPEPPVDVPDS